jgi:hypothetical protein
MGFWWLPEEPARTVGGQLSFTPADGLRLDLVGVLGGDDPYEEHKIVLGTSVDGEPITLESAQQGGRRTVSSVWLPAPVTSHTLRPRIGYLGGHLPSPDQRTFAAAILEIDDLAGWVESWPFRDGLGPEPIGFSVSYEHPAVIRAKADFGEIQISHSSAVFGDGLHERGIRSAAHFVIRLDEPRTIDWWLRGIVRDLQNLLTLVADRPSSVTRFAFLGDDAREIDVLYSPPGSEHPGRPLYHHEFLFHASEVADRMPTILAKWFELTTELAPVVDFLLATRYLPSYVEERFLNVISALEAYHRRRYSNAVLPRAEHRARLERILESVGAEDRGWLRQQLDFSNEPSLRLRLGDLLRRNDGFLMGIFGFDEIVRPAVEVRNRLIHQDPRRSRTALEPSELWSLTEKLTLLLLACLLSDLGISGSQLHDVIVGSVRFRHVVQADRRR